jgi:CRISPR-associated protein Csy3
MSAVKTASVLAFERKLDVSDALFYAGMWEERQNSSGWPAVAVREKSVRGTISNRLKGGESDPAKLDAKIENPNLQTVDVAALPANADTLKVFFTLRILAGVGAPSACNDAAYRAKLADTVAGYIKAHGLRALADRYACNIANGRFLWRNRVGAEKVCVLVEHLVDGKAASAWEFDALALSLHDFEPGRAAAPLAELAALMEAGLSGAKHVLLGVTAFVRLGVGQEVFPSEELILDRARGKSKTLYTVAGVAGIHSQKIGNALRTIDDWYPESAGNGPIAVEPYGSVTTQGKAYRQPKAKMDFYTLLDDWMIKDKAPSLENQHYVVAVLIRGGVFGEKGE